MERKHEFPGAGTAGRAGIPALLLGLLAGAEAPAQGLMGPGVPKVTFTQSDLFKSLHVFHPVSTADPNNKKGMNHVAMHKGYLFVIYGEDSGVPGGGISFYDISNPRGAKLVHAQDESDLRESHGFGFHSRNGKDYAALQSGRGVQFWDFTDVRVPKKLVDHRIQGVEFSDYDHGNWWTMWQAPYVFVSRGLDGFSVLDARNPAAPSQLQITVDGGKQAAFPISKMGNFPIGPNFAIGNLLVVTNRGTGVNSGVSVLDIGDPAAPKLLGTSKEVSGYSSFVNGNKVFWAGTDKHNGRAVIQDISDPANIRILGTSPQAGARGEYLNIQDEFIHMGVEDKYAKIDFSNPAAMRIVNNAYALPAAAQEGFANPIGNLVVITDDHSEGSAIVAHQAEPDTRPPVPNMASPKDMAVRQPLTSRIGFTFTDQIDVQSLNSSTFVVRPVGGQPLTGYYSSQINIVNFGPDSLLKPNTTYEVTLVKGGIKDYAGNGLSQDYVYRFSTGTSIAAPTSVGGAREGADGYRRAAYADGRTVRLRTAGAAAPAGARLVLADLRGRDLRAFPAPREPASRGAASGEAARRGSAGGEAGGLVWDGADGGGKRLPPGLYAARLLAADGHRVLATRSFLLP